MCEKIVILIIIWIREPCGIIICIFILTTRFRLINRKVLTGAERTGKWVHLRFGKIKDDMGIIVGIIRIMMIDLK